MSTHKDKAKHTPEPWQMWWPEKHDNDEWVPTGYPITQDVVRLLDDDGCTLPPMLAAGNTEANARRIVACVNACAGIPNEALEDTEFLAKLMDAYGAWHHGRNKGGQ